MADVYEFYNLGIGDPVPISAASRLGLGDMLDEVVKHFPEYEARRGGGLPSEGGHYRKTERRKIFHYQQAGAEKHRVIVS